MPDIQINFMAILIAVVASFFFGFIWYSFLFGKAWAREMNMDFEAKPPPSEMFRGMALNIIGCFLVAWVLANNLAVYDPTTWGLGASSYSALQHAAMGAFFTWLGFYVPMLLNTVAWERKSWKLFSINASYHLLSLLIVANILTFI